MGVLTFLERLIKMEIFITMKKITKTVFFISYPFPGLGDSDKTPKMAPSWTE